MSGVNIDPKCSNCEVGRVGHLRALHENLNILSFQHSLNISACWHFSNRAVFEQLSFEFQKFLLEIRHFVPTRLHVICIIVPGYLQGGG